MAVWAPGSAHLLGCVVFGFTNSPFSPQETKAPKLMSTSINRWRKGKKRTKYGWEIPAGFKYRLWPDDKKRICEEIIRNEHFKPVLTVRVKGGSVFHVFNRLLCTNLTYEPLGTEGTMMPARPLEEFLSFIFFPHFKNCSFHKLELITNYPAQQPQLCPETWATGNLLSFSICQEGHPSEWELKGFVHLFPLIKNCSPLNNETPFEGLKLST